MRWRATDSYRYVSRSNLKSASEIQETKPPRVVSQIKMKNRIMKHLYQTSRHNSGYLGNTEFITDAGGYPYQCFYYSAFGEILLQQNANTGNFATPNKFNAKLKHSRNPERSNSGEQDPEPSAASSRTPLRNNLSSEQTGNYYYGARYYNPQTSIWFGVDPLAHMYPHLTPYNFVEGNPIMLIDPTGMGSEEVDDIVVTDVDDKGNKIELHRFVTTAVEVEIETEIEVASDYKPKTQKLTQEQEQKIAGVDAVGINLSAGVAVKYGAQIDVSYLQIVSGPEKGARGISWGINGLLGLEGSLDLFHVNFYFASNGEHLSLSDLVGFESGVQGGAVGGGGSAFFGWKVENWQYIETYTGFSFGASIGVTPADATFYTGYSSFLYENYEKVKK